MILTPSIFRGAVKFSRLQVRQVPFAPGRDEGQFDAGHVPSATRGNPLRYDQEQVAGPVLQPIHVSRHEDHGTIIQHNSSRYVKHKRHIVQLKRIPFYFVEIELSGHARVDKTLYQ